MWMERKIRRRRRVTTLTYSVLEWSGSAHGFYLLHFSLPDRFSQPASQQLSISGTLCESYTPIHMALHTASDDTRSKLRARDEYNDDDDAVCSVNSQTELFHTRQTPSIWVTCKLGRAGNRRNRRRKVPVTVVSPG